MTIQATGHRPAAQQEIEEWVAQSWRDLGLVVADASADFFAIGGTSLAAARFLAGAEELFGEDVLPPEDFFEDSSVSAIAAVISRNCAGES
jgi:hypothetical protein